MKFIAIALFAVIGLAAATDKDAEATLVDGSEKVAEYFIPEGYDYKFKTSNDITKSEKANLDSGRVTGEYSYISPEGKTIQVTYEAGAGIGFFPKSDDIAPEIIAAIELNLKNPPEESKRR